MPFLFKASKCVYLVAVGEAGREGVYPFFLFVIEPNNPKIARRNASPTELQEKSTSNIITDKELLHRTYLDLPILVYH